MSTNGQTIRDVVINLRVEADPKNATTFQSAADIARKANERSTKAITKSLVVQRETARSTYDIMIQSVDQYRDHLTDLQSNAIDFRNELGYTTNGAIQLARGFIEIGVASEENLQKAVQTLARFQGVVDIGKGAFKTVQGLVLGYQALTRVIGSATAAHLALNNARRASAAISAGSALTTGASGAAGGAAGRIAGGAIAGATGGAAASTVATAEVAAAGSAAAGALGTLALAGGELTVILGGMAAVSPGFRQAIDEMFDLSGALAESQRERMKYEREYIQTTQRRIEHEEAIIRRSQEGIQFRDVYFQGELRKARHLDRVDPREGPRTREQDVLSQRAVEIKTEIREARSQPGTSQRMPGLMRELEQVMDAQAQIFENKFFSQVQANETKLQETQSRIDQLTQQKQHASGQVQRLQSGIHASTEQFGQLSPRERADRGGLEGFLAPQELNLREARGKVQKIDAQLQNQVEFKITIENQLDPDELTKKFNEQVKPIVEEVNNTSLTRIDAEIRELRRQRKSQDVSRRHAGGY